MTKKIRHWICISALLSATNFCFAQSESRPSIGAGVTYNFIDDDSGNFGDKIGAYVGVETGGKLTEYVGYFGSLQFIQQRSEVSDLNIEVYSINPAFAFKLYPVKKNLYLFAGVQLAFITGFRYNNESLSDFEKSDFFFISGVGYELNERFSIVSRYSHSLNRDYFDGTVQLGVNYCFSKK